MTGPDTTEYEATVMDMLVDLFRICNDNAREFGRQYREQCDRLRRQVGRMDVPDHVAVYSQMKPGDEHIATAMSRWRWWTDEAARVAREISTETLLVDMGVTPMQPWYLHTLRESVTAARRANESLHTERRHRERLDYVMSRPTVSMPRVQTAAQTPGR